jgi:uncharacterized membrane protein
VSAEEDPPSGRPEDSVEDDRTSLRGPWWFRRSRELTGDERHDLLAQVFFEGAERNRFLGRFTVLLVLSIVLATLGLAESSAPVVIGAMLVAPLTSPLMGLCTSLVLGWPRRMFESVVVLAGATVGSIALAFLVCLSRPRGPGWLQQQRAERDEERDCGRPGKGLGGQPKVEAIEVGDSERVNAGRHGCEQQERRWEIDQRERE